MGEWILSDVRTVAERFIEHLENKRVVDAFGMIGENGRYIMIGSTPISGICDGSAAFMNKMGSVLSELADPPRLQRKEIIVDGDRAVILASASGTALGGRPYVQPHLAFVVRVEGDGFAELIEFADTVMIEQAYFNQILVPA
jgi:ketosteroid isomerase-like protein